MYCPNYIIRRFSSRRCLWIAITEDNTREMKRRNTRHMQPPILCCVPLSLKFSGACDSYQSNQRGQRLWAERTLGFVPSPFRLTNSAHKGEPVSARCPRIYDNSALRSCVSNDLSGLFSAASSLNGGPTPDSRSSVSFLSSASACISSSPSRWFWDWRCRCCCLLLRAL